ncbi:isoaspartyl peptidase/L-asparaginase [Deminuibacter soli]|uniref:Isoaspartyl peptidase n=2 Tax=Deminuibacter soli TaxID=2291815 RepID=A0A3E1NC68_9BACT|nr:isoaspartyl peptidase/L-asparaginase [Deminuibacter soli]
MKRCLMLSLFFAGLLAVQAAPKDSLAQAGSKKYILVIHGGAGTILKSQMTPEKEAAYRAGLQRALDAGNTVLKNGGKAIDAVQAAIQVMEDDPHFNAGKGSVFTNEGKNEMDAAIMDGKTLKAGSVAGVTVVRNPITAARAVMDKSEHVLLAGRGAEKFAAQNGCTIVDASYFYTEDRWQGLQKARALDSEKSRLDHDSAHAFLKQPGNRDYKYGTVGAVALDMEGNLAAATSTGGMTNKKFGRVGDAPLIGAGTYANNNTCAISCTGWGEFYIRLVMAKSISDRMELAHQTLQQASDEMIMRQLPALGGDGGMIAVDKDGNFVMTFNTAGMYRGFVKSTGETGIEIYQP